MKKVLINLTLILGFVTLIGACKSSDDSSTAATAAGNIAGTGTTASGSITGNDNLTGVFHMSWWGQEPSGGCIDNSSAVATMKSQSGFASDTQSYKRMYIITGSSSFTESEVQYSDTGCTTMTSYFNKMADNVTIGTLLTGLTPSSSPTFPTSANKISYAFTNYSLFANTTATVAAWNSRFGITVTSGEEKLVAESNIAIEYNVFASPDTLCGTSQTKQCLYTATGSTADNHTDWGSNTSVYWQE